MTRPFLLDGTYELFRQHFGIPAGAREGSTTGATRGVLNSVLTLIGQGASHVGVATDHVVESFRNGLWRGYKTSAGMPPELLAQFTLLEDALVAMGVKVWPMVDLEADDALASAAAVAADDPVVEQVVICTPDKDLAQCVRGARVVQVDRRQNLVYDEAGVMTKYGVSPASIADWLALVGDSADGYPGLPGWGARSAAAVLTRYGHIEDIPAQVPWDVPVRGAGTLAATLRDRQKDALLFKRLATLVVDRSLLGDVEELRWAGPTDAFADLCEGIDAPGLAGRAHALARERAS